MAKRRKEKMKEVYDEYQLICKVCKPIPYWVTEAVAGAYLYLRKAEEPVKSYNLALAKNSDNPFNSVLNLFKAHAELRECEKAERTWGEIDELLIGVGWN